ncbi:MAG: XRE family transcriptional regulator [Cyclobacteriaceae bacterium]
MSSSEYITIQIGTKIKSIRKSQGLKLGDLSTRSQVSIAMLSKIENGRVFPTIPSLIQILRALGVDLNEFFSDLKANEEFPGYLLVKSTDYQPLEKEDESVGFHYVSVLTRVMERSSMEVAVLTLDCNAQRDKVTTAGMEYIYMLSGKVDYELGGDILILEEGDSLLFDGNIPHVPHNRQAYVARLLVVYFIDL